MEKIQVGEIVKLNNNEEYICVMRAEENGVGYLYMMSNFKPLKVFFGREKITENGTQITVVGNPEEKIRLLELFKQEAQKAKENTPDSSAQE